MTEALSHASAEQLKQPEESARMLGGTALEHETHQEITIADLVTRESAHIYEEFLPFARAQKFETERRLKKAGELRRNSLDLELEKQLMMPTIIYDFVQLKTSALMSDRGQHPLLEGVDPLLSRKQVAGNLKQLHFDRAKGRTQNQGDFLAKQKAYEKIATDFSGAYPQVLFAERLHDAFAGNNDQKYARYASDVVNAIGRTIRVMGTQANRLRRTSEADRA